MFSLIIYFIIAAIGFMMVYLYKQTNTTSTLFRPDPKKLMRIFLIVLALATVITFALSILVTYQLDASNIPDESKMAFGNSKAGMFLSINVSFLVLIILANTYSLTVKKLNPWPYVLALAFYALFILKDAYYITNYFVLWQKSMQVIKGDLPDILHSNGWTKVGLGTFVTLLNAGMMWFGLRKP